LVPESTKPKVVKMNNTYSHTIKVKAVFRKVVFYRPYFIFAIHG
jgi:hypothetical protein